VHSGSSSESHEASRVHEVERQLAAARAVASDLQERLDEAHEQLRQAQKTQALGRLARGVAHDFGNLLTIMLGFTEDALAALPAGEARDAVIRCSRTIDRATALTRHLGSLARLRTAPPRPVNLGELARDLHPILSRTLPANVRLEVTAEPELLLATCDPGEMDQVILNLVLNARDAMPAGGTIRMCVSRRSDASGDWVVVTVADDGAGMAPATMSRVFEPFFTTKDGQPGAGLGLSVARDIAQRLGGAISVRSELGAGSVFEASVPATEDGGGCDRG
jgi:signal transduction histidine kinase